MTITTPRGPIVLATSTRELSAYRYLLFNQAWAREVGVGSDMYAADGHFARLGLFLSKKNEQAALGEYNNTLLAFRNLTAQVPVPYLAATLAPLVVSIDGVPRPDTTEAGLAATAAAVLATELTQAQLVEAVEQSKKNFNPI